MRHTGYRARERERESEMGGDRLFHNFCVFINERENKKTKKKIQHLKQF